MAGPVSRSHLPAQTSQLFPRFFLNLFTPPIVPDISGLPEAHPRALLGQGGALWLELRRGDVDAN
jgi:hypothetical protein